MNKHVMFAMICLGSMGVAACNGTSLARGEELEMKLETVMEDTRNGMYGTAGELKEDCYGISKYLGRYSSDKNEYVRITAQVLAYKDTSEESIDILVAYLKY